MTLFYSKTTKGFYDSHINGNEIPSDATEESTWSLTYQELISGQSSGKVISDDDGKPILIDPPALSDAQLVTIARSKRNQLIADTDYLIMPDYPITADKLGLVKTYRQLLRDITKQSGFPTNIDWPAMPE